MAKSDKLGTRWKLEPHTAVKHRILRGYLDAWLPILGSIGRAERILYVDGFAGPGEYEGGEPGSPVIAIRAACEHTATVRTAIRFRFIEGKADRHAHLCEVLKRLEPEIARSPNKIQLPAPIRGDCAEVLQKALDDSARSGVPFGPAFVFLDQFGFSHVPMTLVRDILAQRHCETLTYLHAESMHRFVEQESIHEGLTRAFGSERWRAAEQVPKDMRGSVLAREYEGALREDAGARYTWRFAVHGEGQKLLHWFFFSTNHKRGLIEMKRAMRKADSSNGLFRFSPSENPAQVFLFDQYSDDWLVEHLRDRFRGQEVDTDAIEDHVLQRTPGVTYAAALRRLQRDGALEPVGHDKRVAFSQPRVRVRFK